MDQTGIFFGATPSQNVKIPVWYGFDAAWYRRRYAHVLRAIGTELDDQTLAERWEAGEIEGVTSPNRYFDEEWYLRYYPDVRRSIEEQGIFRSGFQHYIEVGCQSCVGHWLFSAEYYLKENPDYGLRALRNAGYVNAYDHFLSVGDHHFRTPHPFFEPEVFVRECLTKDIPFDPSQGTFSQYLSLEHVEMGRLRTSWYFDPSWYLEQYPDVKELIKAGDFINALHHYLCCDEPSQFNPNPYFDETYYLETYPDVREAVNQGAFRNGYAHFMRSGIRELRNPSIALDMRAFIESLDLPAALHRAHAENPFHLWVMRQEKDEDVAHSAVSVTAARALALKKIEAGLPSLFRQPLRFEAHSIPSLTVILFSQGNYLLDSASLISLQMQGIAGLQIIWAGPSNHVIQGHLNNSIEGIEYYNDDEHLSSWQRLGKILPLVRSDRILLMESGMQILPMTLPAVLQAMAVPHVGGSGKILAANNQVLEAGSAVWRDGSVTLCAQGAEALAQSVSFEREIDAVQGGLLFCQRKGLDQALAYLEGQEAAPLFMCLSIALRAIGETLFYWPLVQAKALHATVEGYVNTPACSTLLRRLFPNFLPTHAISSRGIVMEGKSRPKVMMLFSHLPRKVEGGPTRRIVQQIHLFRRLGWRVMIVGLDRGDEDRLVIPRDYPSDTECWRGVGDIATFLQQHQNGVDLFWLAGTATLKRVGPVLASGEWLSPEKRIILDVVEQNGVGIKAAERHLRRLVGMVDEPQTLLKEVQEELEYAWLCQGIVAGDASDVTLLRRLGYGNVVQIPYAVAPQHIAHDGHGTFQQRNGALFPLPIYHAGDAGHDGFDWFCLSVMPHLQRYFDAQLSIGVSGYHHPLVDIGFYERMAPLDGLAEKGKLFSFLEKCRVVVDPARVLGMQALEVLEAAAQGVPAILSTPQMERLGWKDEEEALDGGFNAPEHFAQQVIRLYEDPDLWAKLRDNAHAFVCREHNAQRQYEIFKAFIEGLSQKPKIAERPLERADNQQSRAFAPAPLYVKPKPHLVPEPHNATDHEEDDEPDEVEDDLAPLPTRLGVTLSNNPDANGDAQTDE